MSIFDSQQTFGYYSAMRLLFVYDHRFLRGEMGRLHTAGSFPSYVWNRYLRHFHEIVVLARDGGQLPAGWTLAVSNHSLVQFEFARSLASLRQSLAPSAQVRAQMQRALTRSDALVVRLPSLLGILAAKTARRMGKPYAVEIVGCAWDGYVNHGAPAARLYAPFYFHRMRRTILNAPLALYVTRQWLQSRYPTRAYSSSASNVEIAPFDEVGRRNRDRMLCELRKGRRPKVGTVAALTMRIKGVQTAVAAIAHLRADGLDLPYAVLGPGDPAPWEALARQMGVADLVSFDGTRSAGEPVRQWLDGIDVHLQPSFQEGLPRATIEAMSRGVACIGSTCGGIPELLSPEWTHKPGEVRGLADCIRRMACDPDAVVASSAAGLEGSRDFDADILRARRDDVFGRLRRMAERQQQPPPAAVGNSL